MMLPSASIPMEARESHMTQGPVPSQTNGPRHFPSYLGTSLSRTLVTAPFSNNSTWWLPLSTTHIPPAGSISRPVGNRRSLPNNWVAIIPDLSGGTKTSTRLFKESATYTLPEASTRTAAGANM